MPLLGSSTSTKLRLPSLPSSPGTTKAAGVGDRHDREGVFLLLMSTGLAERWEKKWGKDLLDHKALQHDIWMTSAVMLMMHQWARWSSGRVGCD